MELITVIWCCGSLEQSVHMTCVRETMVALLWMVGCACQLRASLICSARNAVANCLRGATTNDGSKSSGDLKEFRRYKWMLRQTEDVLVDEWQRTAVVFHTERMIQNKAQALKDVELDCENKKEIMYPQHWFLHLPSKKENWY